jgi:hypothetical protein
MNFPVISMRRTWHVLFLLIVTFISGCTGSSSQSGPATSATQQDEQGKELFDWSINILNHVDEYETVDATQQVLERLNQWIAEQPALRDWQVDPLVSKLPKEFRDLRQMQGLDEMKFKIVDDNNPLLEAVWMRDVAKGAVGNETHDLARAKKLFDWTVRNIQLDSDDKPGVYHYLAADTLFFGHGAALDRAWVFILLARQQDLDVVMLALPAEGDEGKPHPWLPALLLDGQLYLFDTRLGLAIPAPGSQPLAEEVGGEKSKGVIDVATLAQAAADDAVLRRMDLPDAPYPVKSSDLAKVVALIEASPMYLTERMQIVELRLAGDRRVVLTTQPSRVAERLKACPQIAETRLWTFPLERYRADADPDADKERSAEYERQMKPFKVSRMVRVRGAKFKQDPSLTAEGFRGEERAEVPQDQHKEVAALWQARVVHLMGKYTGNNSATELYQVSRPFDADLDSDDFTPQQRLFMPRAKQDASYWLGLISFERGRSSGKPNYYNTAIHYFDVLTLKASPTGPWTAGARYNLGRTYEALGKADQAIVAYRSDKSSPQTQGNLLRAKWLEERAKK